MDENAIYEYFIQMGAMRPEQDRLKRKQALINALGGNSMTLDKGEMIGKHYVGPGIGGALSKLGQAYFAKQGQAGLDTQYSEMDQRQRDIIESLRKRQKGYGTAYEKAMDWGEY